MNELTDEELVLQYQAQSGLPEGRVLVDELFGRHHVRVASWCYRMTGDRESAADLAQEIFLKAYRHIGTFRRDSKFTTWLYTIARNHCRNELRSRSARLEDAGELELLEVPTNIEAADVALERRSAEQVLRELMVKELDETERRVMSMHYADEMSLDAITRLLGLRNASGAKAFIVSARRKLASAITKLQRPRVRATADGVTDE